VGQGWQLSSTLAQNPEHLAYILAQMAHRYHCADLRYLTGLLLNMHLHSILTLGMFSIWQMNCLPFLGMDSIAFQYDLQGQLRQLCLLKPTVYTLADDVTNIDALRVDDIRVLWEYLREMIVAHAEWLVPALHQHVQAAGQKWGQRALWLMCADQVVSQAIYIAKRLGKTADLDHVVKLLVQYPNSPLCAKTGVFIVEAQGRREYFVKRSSCCFIYLAQDAHGHALQRCRTCPYFSREVRQQLLTDYVRRQS